MTSRPDVFVSADLAGLAGPDFDSLGPLRDVASLREVSPGEAPLDRATLRAELGDAEGLLCMLTDRIDAALIDEAPQLRVISTVSVGVDHIDLDAARKRGVAVGNTPGVLTETTAELALALILAASRRIAEADRFVRAGSWRPEQPWSPDMLLGVDLSGATLGIVGMGAIGEAVAERARAFGMRVIAWSRTPKPVNEVEFVPLESLLAEADVVSLHVALTPDTHHLIDADALSRMKPDAVLVNTARGPVVDEVALAAALAAGRLAGVGLDVFEVEPLSPQSPLLEFDRVVFAPHIGSASVRTRRRMASLAVENLRAGLAGEPLPHSAL